MISADEKQVTALQQS